MALKNTTAKITVKADVEGGQDVAKLGKMYDDLAKKVDGLAKELKAKDKQLSKLGNTAGSAGGKISAVFSKLKSFGGGISSGLAVAATAGFQFVKRLGELSDQGHKYNIIQKNLKISIDDARKSTQGMVSDMTLMTEANKAHSLGLKFTASEYARVAKSATILAQKIGGDATKAVQDLITGMARQSPQILDNLGLTVKMSDAVANFKRQLKLGNVELSETGKRQAFLIEVQRQLIEKTEGIKVNASAWQVLKASVENAKNEMASWISRSPFVKMILEEWAIVIRNLTKGVGWLAEGFKAVGSVISWVGDKIMWVLKKAWTAFSWLQKIHNDVVKPLADNKIFNYISLGGLKVTSYLTGITGSINKTLEAASKADEIIKRGKKNFANRKVDLVDAVLPDAKKVADREQKILDLFNRFNRFNLKSFTKSKKEAKKAGKAHKDLIDYLKAPMGKAEEQRLQSIEGITSALEQANIELQKIQQGAAYVPDFIKGNKAAESEFKQLQLTQERIKAQKKVNDLRKQNQEIDLQMAQALGQVPLSPLQREIQLLERKKQVLNDLKETQASYSNFLNSTGTAAVNALGDAIWSSVEAAVTGGESMGKIFAKITKDLLFSVAKQATVQAVFETAKGLAASASFNFASAAAHFASAGKFAATAIIAGGAGAGIAAASGGGSGSSASRESSAQTQQRRSGASGSFGSSSKGETNVKLQVILGNFIDPSATLAANKEMKAKLLNG